MRTLSLSQDDLLAMPRMVRATLVNGLSGYKCPVLIGTASESGQTNLAVFNSLVHIGANPPLLGFIQRPLTVDRHTYENFKASGYCTLNFITERIHREAHQTSAKYERTTSEFAAVGFSPVFDESFPAPFVRESPVRLGLRWEEEHHIRANDTRLVVGQIEEVFLPESMLHEDGWLDWDLVDVVASTGLDTYHRAQRLSRLAFARPEVPLRELD